MSDPELTHILIVATDALLAQGLCSSLHQYGYAVTGVARNATEAEQLFKEKEVDLILVDIHMPGNGDGIDMTLELMKIKRVPVIYLIPDANAEIISRIKQTYPVGFVVKPCDGNCICMTVELLLHNSISRTLPDIYREPIPAGRGDGKKKEQDLVDSESILRQGSYIFIKRNFRFVKIMLSEILYMEADGNYVHIVIKDKKFTLRLSLMQVIRKINYSKFARINRSSVVNVDAIQSFNKEQVVIGQFEIAIGKNYKESFFRQLGFS